MTVDSRRDIVIARETAEAIVKIIRKVEDHTRSQAEYELCRRTREMIEYRLNPDRWMQQILDALPGYKK